MNENELSSIIIGEGIKVHQQLGPGLLESVYEECLCYRLIKTGIAIERQKPIPLIFEEVKLECGFRCDILIEGKVIVEVKAVEGLNDIHLAQVLTYLKLTNTKLGLLMNFNVLRLKEGLKRIVNNL
ncbi:MAG: GxxExxY protein [Sphingobacteriales bacterium]|nr:GxxExxY protein [Sphingobacteriales bacterium]